MVQPGGVERRLSDVDRQRAIEILQKETARGVLELDEFEERVGSVLEARTQADLEAVFADLGPVQSVGEGPRRRPVSALRDTGFRSHATVYGLVNGFLVGIWAMTDPGGFFWPFFPAGGWGVALGLHAAGVRAAQRHQTRRARQGDDRQHHDRQQDDRQQRVSPPSRAAVPPAASAALGSLAARRQVAVLFSDVVGSTRLNEALGDEGWRGVRRRHHELLEACFRSHGGTEVGAAGDGFLACFATPEAAVRCAIDVQRRVAAERAATGFTPEVRIGIHCGEAVEDAGELIGKVVNLAARVVGEADAGEIVVTEPVAERLGPDIELHDRGLRQLKGLDHPRHLLAVAWHA